MSTRSECVSMMSILGGLVATLVSYVKWHSVILALIHGLLLGWVYVIYFWIRYGFHNLQF